ncbi:M20/M25/M40 family metallo-hydrolase [Alicyclobacillus sp. SO9]|uniref:M20/M25/M40 family metallo-hydrolase n=1 Tax=Alicyclobacillus sp. SO9 TaxID=2665646 RepID=UPI0018E86135|nr:M20/M25/M40 family metallo-hydrolase [Alicyclobacillus sp. SO9]QQE76922.1 M20/M25/M40 family metallo-hydrolase [Alicyclobacillus sp. SO9]
MNFEDVRDLFLELVQIDSPSFYEKAMADRCRELLEQLGCTVTEDDAGKRLQGEQGNLIATLPGNLDRTPVLLAAHMDTVQPGIGVMPQIDDSGVVRSSGDTVLGADDKAGVTAIVSALREIVQNGRDHGPIQIVLTVCEEQGLQGSKQLEASQLNARLGLSLDSGDAPGTLIVAGPTQVKWQAEFRGKSAHAGVAPEKGVSAIKVASQAVAKMPHGRLDKGTTVNVGSFVGDGPTNVVRDKVTLLGEARGLNTDSLNSVIAQIEETFANTAAKAHAEVSFEHKVMYDGFRFEETDAVRQMAEKAIANAGLQVHAVERGGGSDANIYTALGVPTINIAVGYEDIHSTKEHVSVHDIMKAANVIIEFLDLA